MDGYTPTVWAAGDTVTAAKLNKMEQGIADGYSSGGGLVVHVNQSGDTYTLDKTWQEIWDAMESGQSVLVVNIESESGSGSVYHVYVNSIYFETGEITDYVVDANGNFTASSPSGYPSYTMK